MGKDLISLIASVSSKGRSLCNVQVKSVRMHVVPLLKRRTVATKCKLINSWILHRGVLHWICITVGHDGADLPGQSVSGDC